jgi:hypothetical protein
VLTAGLFATGCSDPAVADGQQEIAAELRALRIALQASERNVPAPTAIDRQAFTAALAPLREVLDSLVAQQHELQTRQLALTQELQRWSQLLAQSVTGGNRTEVEALTARLQQFEATLKAQEARHQEVEKLLGGALDRTADQLDAFLRKLEATIPANGSTPATPGSGTTSPPGSAPDAPARKTGALEPGPGDSPGRTRRNTTAWWLGLLGTAGFAGAVFVWRWRRSAAAGTAPGAESTVVDRGEDAHDPAVEELWAAAAMLGEAVGKLKANQQAAGGAGPTGLDDGIGLAEVFVLDEEPRATAGPAAPATPREPGEGPGARASPPLLRCRLAARDPAQAVAVVLRALADDPRVLQRPVPTATAARDAIDVAFAVLPGLSPGERSHVEQRLRDVL